MKYTQIKEKPDAKRNNRSGKFKARSRLAKLPACKKELKKCERKYFMGTVVHTCNPITQKSEAGGYLS